MFYFSDTLDLLGKYIFDGIEALNETFHPMRQANQAKKKNLA